jgi:dUTP pyrophosphatase
MVDRLKVALIHPNAVLPAYATSGAAGMDLHACLDQDLTLQPMERSLIPTGLVLEIPEGYEAQVRPRSGLAAKHGLTVLNTPGTVDYDYRGEIKVILINLGSEPYIIRSKDRIAQMVVSPVPQMEIKLVASPEHLSKTQRGSGGFGSTGISS